MWFQIIQNCENNGQSAVYMKLTNTTDNKDIQPLCPLSFTTVGPVENCPNDCHNLRIKIEKIKEITVRPTRLKYDRES